MLRRFWDRVNVFRPLCPLGVESVMDLFPNHQMFHTSAVMTTGGSEYEPGSLPARVMRHPLPSGDNSAVDDG